MKFEWEVIFDLGNPYEGRRTMRAKVFGGWIVCDHIYEDENHQLSEAMVFIPDSSHQWIVD